MIVEDLLSLFLVAAIVFCCLWLAVETGVKLGDLLTGRNAGQAN